MTPLLTHDPACHQVVDLLTAYLDGALAPVDAVALEAHLAECDGCDTVLAQLRTTIAVLGRLAAHDVQGLDDQPREALMGAFRSWAAGRPRR